MNALFLASHVRRSLGEFVLSVCATHICSDGWTGVLTFLSALLVAFILIYKNVFSSFDITQNYSVIICKYSMSRYSILRACFCVFVHKINAITTCENFICANPFQWRISTRLFALCVFLTWHFFFCRTLNVALVGIPKHRNKMVETQKHQKKQKKNQIFDTIYGSFGCIRLFVLSCNEHVHQIYYSMIPFAFMLVAYCMRYLLSLLYPGSSDNKHILFRIIHSFFSSLFRLVCSYGNLDFYIIFCLFLVWFFFSFGVIFGLFLSRSRFVCQRVWTVQ